MFNVDLTFLWTAVNLALMYFFIKKFVFGRLAAKMDERSAAIAADVKKGEELEKNTQLFKLQQEEWRRDTAESRQAIMAEAKTAAEREADRILREAAKEASRIKEEAKLNAGRELEAMRRELLRETADLALAAASGVIKANMDDERNRKLAEEFISEREAS